ncbi:hypothetical protein ACA910_016399 [Epithemia clementina (nom. ined.)]
MKSHNAARYRAQIATLCIILTFLVTFQHLPVHGLLVGQRSRTTRSAVFGENALYSRSRLTTESLRPTKPFSAIHVHNERTLLVPQSTVWRGVSPIAAQAPTARRASSTSTTRLCMWSKDDDEISGFGNRVKCCFPYLLPLLDGDHFGRFIYERIPPLGLANELLLGPLVQINNHVPFFGLAFFLALTLGTRFNFDMDRNIRYNAQLAALIDIALILPELIASGFEEGDVPRFITEPCSNFVWYAYTTAVVYCMYSNLRGKKPSGIPYLSQSAEWMVGPF